MLWLNPYNSPVSRGQQARGSSCEGNALAADHCNLIKNWIKID